jgi:hypothetical protein
MSTSKDELLLAAACFERGEGVGGFARRMRLERALFYVTSIECERELGINITGFNAPSLGAIKQRIDAACGSFETLSRDGLVGFELRQQLVALSLSEPYRFSATESIGSGALRDFGLRLRRWVVRLHG